MSTPPRIGFIGFGEAGYHLAKGLRQSGIEQIAAYDIQSTAQIRQRAAETQTTLAASNADLGRRQRCYFLDSNRKPSRRRSLRDCSVPPRAISTPT